MTTLLQLGVCTAEIKKKDLPEVSTIFHDLPISFSCHCSSSGSMILGAQIVRINEGKGKLALFRTKDNGLLTPPPPPPSPSQLTDFSLFFFKIIILNFSFSSNSANRAY